MIPKSLEKQINSHEFLMAREELMYDIDKIVGEYFESWKFRCSDLGEIDNFDEARDCLIKELCDSVCNNFNLKQLTNH
tara:strand:- start:4690 stop:4923 length:234 start_codon:yes stop_codon:yes gene_type:complete